MFLGGQAGQQNFHNVFSAKITDTTFTGNVAGHSGGGLYLQAPPEISTAPLDQVTIEQSEFLNNSAGTGGNPNARDGGGMYIDLRGTNDFDFTVNLFDSYIAGNTAEGDGGGVWFCTKVDATFNVKNSTIYDNRAGHMPQSGPVVGEGGGLWLSTLDSLVDRGLTANLENLTVSGNRALSQGGGIWTGMITQTPIGNSEMIANLDHLTITDNWSPEGGGLYSDPDPTFLRVRTTLSNTLVSGNYDSAAKTVADNIAGTIEAVSSYNLIGTGTATNPTTGTGNIFSDTPGLAALADNGGPTFTHLLLAGSAAIDAGNPTAVAGVGNTPFYDQRGTGFSRVIDELTVSGPAGPIDIGALELQPSGDNTGPKITDVIISNSSGDSFSMDTVDGSGDQLNPIPVYLPDKVSVVFSEPIDVATISDNSLSVTRLILHNLSSPNVSNFNYDPGTYTATWDVSWSGQGDLYAVSINDTVTDTSGNALDGEWVNPLYTNGINNTNISTFNNMGDNAPGGVFTMVVTVVAGELIDVGTTNIDGLDLGALLGAWYPFVDPVSTPPIFGSPADLNLDGYVDGLDLGTLLGNWHFDWGTTAFADYNDNQIVDTSDLAIISGNIGVVTSNATFNDGDLNGDGAVTIEDYDIAYEQFRLGIFLDWIDNS